MTGKETTKKKAAVPKEKREKQQRARSIFPTDIGKLSKEECAKLTFKPDGIAQAALEALRKHGTEAGEKRKLVFDQVKAKFGDASEATIRTQIYRGIVYLRAVPRPQAATPR